jgi:hypothetical protein
MTQYFEMNFTHSTSRSHPPLLLVPPPTTSATTTTTPASGCHRVTTTSKNNKGPRDVNHLNVTGIFFFPQIIFHYTFELTLLFVFSYYACDNEQ